MTIKLFQKSFYSSQFHPFFPQAFGCLTGIDQPEGRDFPANLLRFHQDIDKG
jgi:hypothetical protein